MATLSIVGKVHILELLPNCRLVFKFALASEWSCFAPKGKKLISVSCGIGSIRQ